MLRRLLHAVFVVIVTAAIAAPISLNFEKASVLGGYDNVLVSLWNSLGSFRERVIDSNSAWLFWLGIGLAVGFAISSRIRRLEEASRGRLGGPSFRYLRWQARAIRAAIAFPWLRRISGDLDSDLVDLNRVLSNVHGLPPLPTTTFADQSGLLHTSEYLRLILPNLTARHIAEARASATRYIWQIAVTP